VIDGNLLHVDL